MDELIFINGAAFTRSPKTDADGNPLYLLPQEDLEIRTPFTRRVESLEVSDEPVLVEIVEKVPLLDDKGKQVSYTPTYWDEEKEKQVPVLGAVPILCSTTEITEAHKATEDGQFLYWHNVSDEAISYAPQEPLEITAEDERYTEDLEQAFTLTPWTPEPPPLEQVRDQKLAELQGARDSAIYTAFKSDALGELKTYGYDREAAQNFRDKGLKLTFDASITSIPWYTLEDRAFVTHTRDEFIEVLKDAGNREELLKMEYYVLEAQVENAYRNENREALLSISW